MLASLGRQGVPLTIDIMLNDGHAGRAVRIGADKVPWDHRVAPNGGDCLKTAHIGRHDLPRRLQSTCSGGASCMRQLYCMRHIYCKMRLYCRAGGDAPRSEAAPGARQGGSPRRFGGHEANNRSRTGTRLSKAQRHWLDETRRREAG